MVQVFKKTAIFLFVMVLLASCSGGNGRTKGNGGEKKRPLFVLPLKFF